MSFNYNPEWAKINDSELKKFSACPHCKTKFRNYEEVTECIYDMDTYNTRHIPPQLTFNCFNPNCEYCDDEFTYNLEVTIHIKSET
jgi:hypothetical protein